jgi:hypothetical protein
MAAVAAILDEWRTGHQEQPSSNHHNTTKKSVEVGEY